MESSETWSPIFRPPASIACSRVICSRPLKLTPERRNCCGGEFWPNAAGEVASKSSVSTILTGDLSVMWSTLREGWFYSTFTRDRDKASQSPSYRLFNFDPTNPAAGPGELSNQIYRN